VGKSSYVIRFVCNHWVESYDPTIGFSLSLFLSPVSFSFSLFLSLFLFVCVCVCVCVFEWAILTIHPNRGFVPKTGGLRRQYDVI